jgi:hypothetical protein
MYPSVADAFWSSVAGAEGVVRWPYNDDKGWVTTAMGAKFDNGTGQAPAAFIALPWKIEAPGLAARKATNGEIQTAWLKVKSHQDWNGIGGGNQKWQDLTDIRLDDDAIKQITADWLRSNEPTIIRFFPGYPTSPADAQLVLIGMSYALGSAFAQSGWSKFVAAMNAVPPNYEEAAAQSQITKDVNSAIAEHNATNYQLLLNAAAAMHSRTPFDRLWWPGNVDPGTGKAASTPPVSVAIMGTAGHFGLIPGFLGRFVISATAVTLAMLGVSVGVAVARGQPWQTPFRQVAGAGRARALPPRSEA